MTTTTLRVELLIIGFQSSIALVVGLLDEMLAVITRLPELKEFALLLTIALLGWCYSLGATIDAMLALIERWRSPSDLFGAKQLIHPTYALVMLKYPEAYADLRRRSFDIRLLRGTSFNLLAIALAAAMHPNLGGLAVGAGIGGLLSAASWYRRRVREKMRTRVVGDFAASLLDAAAKPSVQQESPRSF